MVALIKLFKQVTDLAVYWKLNKFDVVLWLITFITSVILNVDYGLAIGVGCSLVFLFYINFKPYGQLVGSLEGTEFFLDLKNYNVSLKIKY